MAQVQNKKLDIIVGIPTYNEADSISNTVQRIDRGLSRYFPEHKALIVNIDSQSNIASLFNVFALSNEKLMNASEKKPSLETCILKALLLVLVAKRLHPSEPVRLSTGVTASWQ